MDIGSLIEPTRLAAILAWTSYRSYKATENMRLLFVVLAFVAFALKSFLIFVNEIREPHPMEHHVILFVAGVFDVLIVLLLFIPFFTGRRESRSR
jgi:hypothetical protein